MWRKRVKRRTTTSDALVARFGEVQGHALARRYAGLFPEYYKSAAPIFMAEFDVDQFEQLGFRVLGHDGDEPWRLLEELVAAALAGESWRTHPTFLRKVSRASRRLYLKYDYDELVTGLYQKPVGTADGDLTATRDYNVYVRAFDEGAERKAALVREHTEGRRDHTQRLWTLLMLELWFRNHIDPRPGRAS